jgi:hypothetical protein
MLIELILLAAGFGWLLGCCAGGFAGFDIIVSANAWLATRVRHCISCNHHRMDRKSNVQPVRLNPYKGE